MTGEDRGFVPEPVALKHLLEGQIQPGNQPPV